MNEMVSLALAFAGLAFTMLAALIGAAVAYGGLQARVSALEHDTKKHDSYIGQLREAKGETVGYRKASESIHEE